MEDLALLASLAPDRLTPVPLVLGIPLLASLLLAVLPGFVISSLVNVTAAVASLAAIILLLFHPAQAGPLVLVEGFNLIFLLLCSFLFLTASLFAAGWFGDSLALRRLSRQRLRRFYPLWQGFWFCLVLALISNNSLLFVLGLGGGFLILLLLLRQQPGPRAGKVMQATLPLFCLAILLGLAGAILLSAASMGAFSPAEMSGDRLLMLFAFSELWTRAPLMDPWLAGLAWACFLAGFGTLAAFIPFQDWWTRFAVIASPPLAVLVAGPGLSVAFYGILRIRMILAATHTTPDAHGLPEGMLLTIPGIVLLVPALFQLSRDEDIRCLLARTARIQIGVCAIAFGIGGSLLNFAALLHLLLSALGVSAALALAGHIARRKGSASVHDFHTLARQDRMSGRILVILLGGLAGLPPGGLFMSFFMILSASYGISPLLALLPVLAWLLLASGILLKLQHILLAPSGPAEPALPERSGAVAKAGNAVLLRRGLVILPVLLHLIVFLLAGIWMPDQLFDWAAGIASGLG